MAISVSSDINAVMDRYKQTVASTNRADKLGKTLSGGVEGKSDEELMEACKSFEAYLLEQVLTSVKETLVPEDEKKNEYLNMFGDKLYEEYAGMIAESGDLGIAQKLYEAMKRQQTNE